MSRGISIFLIRKRKYTFKINHYFHALLHASFNDRKENLRTDLNFQELYVTNSYVLFPRSSLYLQFC